MVPPVAMASSSGWAWKKVMVAIAATLPARTRPHSPRPLVPAVRPSLPGSPPRARLRSGWSLQWQLGSVGQRKLPGEGSLRAPPGPVPAGHREDAVRLEGSDLPVARAPADHLDRLGPVAAVDDVGAELPCRPPEGQPGDDHRVAGPEPAPRLRSVQVIRRPDGGAACGCRLRPVHRTALAGPVPVARLPRGTASRACKGSATFLTHHPEAMEEQDDHGDDRQHGGQVTGIAEGLQHMAVAGPEGIAETGQCRAPDGAADHGEDDELPDCHLTQACSEGHEGTEQRDEPPEEHQGLAVAGEPRIGPVEVLVGEQHVLAEPVDQYPASEPSSSPSVARTMTTTSSRW